jgi:[protein-PII] uridylyltransferase
MNDWGPGNHAATTLHRVHAYLQPHQAELTAMLDQPGASGVGLARRHADIMDGLLVGLHAAACATVQEKRCALPPMLFAAVGGYGRKLLGLKSDLDIRFLTKSSPDRVQPFVEAMLYPLWDAGIGIGHQVVTIADMVATAKHDLPTATTLLDWRFIAGDVELGRSLEERAAGGIFEEGELPAFMGRLGAEVSERHRRFGNSVYLLEPDVKSGAGGLRDLDVGLWAAQARWRVRDLAELVRLGVLVAGEAEEIHRAADFLWTVRNHLHKRAGRRIDRLTFEGQEIIARAMGYGARVAESQPPPAATLPEPSLCKSAYDVHVSGPMVEAFMSDYYRHARAITKACEQLIARATPHVGHRVPRQQDLGHGLRAFDGQVTFADPKQIIAEPALVLRLYATAVARGLPVLPFARDTVARAASDPGFCSALRADEEAAALFVSLVCTARETRFRDGSVLAELHDVGLLLAMIPEFAPVVGRVHHDVYHVYTVDVHSVAAVDQLLALMRGDLLKTFPLACHLAAEVSRPELLCLVALLHDVGKTIGRADHAERGAEMARVILSRLGFSSDDVEDGAHLILHHLLMYVTAARRDIEDPATIARFADQVGGREALRDLYLLTVVDVSTTSPTSMTKWKSRMLDALFGATDAALSGSPLSDIGRLAHVRAQVEALWGASSNREFLQGFLDTMPPRYLLTSTPAEIVAHAQVALGVQDEPINAALVPSRHPDVAELCIVTNDRVAEICVVTPDRPGLLAAISAAIVASRLEVYAAQVNSRRLPEGGVQAVDIFWVRDRAGGLEGVERALPKLSSDLRSVLSGAVAAEELAKRPSPSPWSERSAPMVLTDVAIDNHVSSEHTVIEVVTKDRPGLLFTLAEAMHQLGLSIALAKIDTEGNRVADVFYVTEFDGRKLDTQPRVAEVRTGLLTALGALP